MKDFFDEVDSTGIVEDHINQILGLEHSESKRILKSYNEVKNDLIERLASLPRGTFTAQHLRGVLAQVEAGIIAMNAELSGQTLAGANKAALLGVDGLLTQMKEFDEKFSGAVTPININASLIASDTSKLLVKRYNTNLDQYGKGLYEEISHGLLTATIGETTQDEVVARIASKFGGEEWQLARIVRTELHNVVNLGKIKSMEELQEDIPDLLKTLMHPMDSRTGADSKFAASLKLVEKIEDPFEYTWKKLTRVFMAPPDRPNDRSVIVPYRKEWGKLREPGFISGKFADA